MKKSTLGTLALVASAGLAASANAQLIGGVDDTTLGIMGYDLALNSWSSLATGVDTDVWGLAADDAGGILWANSGSDLISLPYGTLIPSVVGTINVGGTTKSMVSLAYDSTTGTLYGTSNIGGDGGATPEALYSINTATAEATLVLDYASASYDFGGLAYNPADGLLYGTSDTSPNGLYSINPTTGLITLVVAYPSGETDIDGLAIGDNKAYFVIDQPGDIAVYNIGTASFEASIPSPWGTSEVFSAGAWAPGLFAPPADFDVNLALGDSPDPVIGSGDITYTVSVANPGALGVTGASVDVVLDAGLTYVSDTGGGSLVGNTLTVNLGAIAGAGNAGFEVVATPGGEGTFATSATVSIVEVDPNLVNNTANASTEVIILPERPYEAIFSEIAADASSDVPGLAGAKFDSFDRPYRSPDGTKWIISASTDQATTTDEVIIVGSGTTGTVEVQEGTPASWAPGENVGLIDRNLSINNAGDYAFATNTDGPTTADEQIVSYDAVAEGFTLEAVEGDPFPVFPNDLYGTILDSANILADGTVAFRAPSTVGVLTTDEDDFIFVGSTVVAQELHTIPTGQPGGETEGWDLFDTQDFYMSADGSHHIIQGDLTGSTLGDDVVVVDGGVVLQEATIIDTDLFASPLDLISEIHMSSDGSWMARGDNEDDQDWVVRNGAVVAATGDEIFPGAGLFYSNAAVSTTFFTMAQDNNGNFVIGGGTDAGDASFDAMLVLNGTTVISRESDPVDLDGNGQFDDGVFIETYNNEDCFLSDDGYFYFTCDLKDGINGSDVGQAFLRIKAFDATPPCAPDLTGSIDPNDPGYGVPDGVLDANDFFFYLGLFGAGNLDADLTGSIDPNNPAYGVPDGVLDGNDFFFYLDLFAAGCP